MTPAELFRAAGRAIWPLSEPYQRHFCLAERLGATSRQICRWEAGTHAVPRCVWRKLYDELNSWDHPLAIAIDRELQDCPQLIRAWAAFSVEGYELDRLTRE
jgi:hypothetical protein